MARRLRFNGNGSGVNGCPAVHEDLDSGEVIVHGPPLTDPEDIAQLRHLSPGEVPVVVPRELLVDFGPKEVDRVPHIIDLDEFDRLFTRFEHVTWRLETRRRYASDEATEDFWILDSRTVALLNFDEDDNFVDVELITEPAEVLRYAQVRDAASHYAVPYEVFQAK